MSEEAASAATDAPQEPAGESAPAAYAAADYWDERALAFQVAWRPQNERRAARALRRPRVPALREASV
jgi:hypothetical protein